MTKFDYIGCDGGGGGLRFCKPEGVCNSYRLISKLTENTISDSKARSVATV